MSRFEVKYVSYNDLNETEKMGASNNGFGKEWATYVRVVHNGKTILLESDACEPEDRNFNRDLNWVRDAIERAYRLGCADTVDEVRSVIGTDDFKQYLTVPFA